MTLAGLIEAEARSLDADGQKAAKKAAALGALELVESGMTIGLGTGSTVAYFLDGLARRVQSEGLVIKGVPTSLNTARLALQYGIALVDDGDFPSLANDLCVDGADRVDRDGHLIKGGGGALLREKMVAAHSRRLCIMADATKLEAIFGSSFPLPVECVSFGIASTMESLAALGCEPLLRRQESGQVFKTDNGNCIVDCKFPAISQPGETEASALIIPGVVEVGLFVSRMETLILGRPDGTHRRWPLSALS